MQIIIPFLLLFLFFLANGRRRQYCHEDDQILIKPKNSTFYNTQYTRMLRDTFFLGTGTEFHFRGNGKLVFSFSLFFYFLIESNSFLNEIFLMFFIKNYILNH